MRVRPVSKWTATKRLDAELVLSSGAFAKSTVGNSATGAPVAEFAVVGSTTLDSVVDADRLVLHDSNGALTVLLRMLPTSRQCPSHFCNNNNIIGSKAFIGENYLQVTVKTKVFK